MFDDLNDLNLEWFVRENEEVDEKLPMMAKDVRARGIDYDQLDKENLDESDVEVVHALMDVLSDNLDSYDQMTQEEIAHAVQQLWIAAVLVECVEEGLLEEADGVYTCKK